MMRMLQMILTKTAHQTANLVTLTIDKEIIFWHILTKGNSCSSVITEMENSRLDPKPSSVLVGERMTLGME